MELLLLVVVLLIVAAAAYQFLPHPLGQFVAFVVVVIVLIWLVLAIGDGGLTVGDGQR